MTRILYIAPVRDFSGYATAARGYINALYRAGADLVVRAIRYDRADSGSEYAPTKVEKELLSRPLENIDVVIQHTTPNEMRPVEGKVNVAVVAWETTRIPGYWAEKLNKFDAVITFCEDSVRAFKDSGVTVPIWKIPHTFDIPSYTLDGVEKIASPTEPKFFDGKFVFYNISQLSTKKGLDILLKAYFTQFHGRKDEVMLVLKTYIDMSNREYERERIRAFVNSVKNALRLPADGYPNVMVIPSTMTEEQIKKIHKTGDCYVCSSRAEGWCIPAFEALAYGKKLITTSWGGMGEFAAIKDEDDWGKLSPDRPKENVFLLNYSLEPLIGQGHGDPELYTAKDFVAEPSVRSMMEKMEEAMKASMQERASMMEFDYSVVGPMMLDVITGTYAASHKEESNV